MGLPIETAIQSPAKPANEVVFSNRKDVNLPNLCFADNMIRRLNSQKHLGLTLDGKLTFIQQTMGYL